jgi:hypothetical protein
VAASEVLGVKTVPEFGFDWDLDEIVDYVQNGVESQVIAEENRPGEFTMDRLLNEPEGEGIIARTDPYLFNQRGKRVMFKLKGEDLQREGAPELRRLP